MPTRREAIAAGAVAVLATAIPGGVVAAPVRPLKAMFRLENGQWVRRRMSEFQVGNYMKYVNKDDPPVYARVASAPGFDRPEDRAENRPGEWGCTVEDIKPEDIPSHLLPRE